MRISFSFLILAVILISSCEKSSLDHYQSQKIDGPWQDTDTLIYEFSDLQLENSDLQLKIEHTNDFKYENIYLAVIGSDNEKKVFSVALANQKGQWIGQQSSKNYKLRQSISERVRSGDRKFKIIHQAREDHLEGVVSIGMGVAK